MKKRKNKKSVLYFGTFPPRECGIATFTKDLVTAMDKKFNPTMKSEILAINDNGSNIYNYNKKVSFQIDETNIKSYVNVANKINDREDIKIVCIQHEFGLFGGLYGDYLLKFLDSIKKPVSITFHSVIPKPDKKRKELIRAIFEKVNAVIVLAKDSIRIFKEDYGLNTDKVYFIPHGVPQAPLNCKELKEKLNLKNRIILSTFGLLSSGKGIEYVIQALPNIVKKYPEVLYLIIGETHPQVRKKEGESYRNKLRQLVNELGLKNNVKFYNKYLTLKEIVEYLCATDIYISPALDKNQIVSGTLSYALGCGKAIISTPSLYAEEVLCNKRGILVDFQNPRSMEKAIGDILSNNRLRESLEKNAYKLGRKMVWPNVAANYLRVFNKITKLREDIVKRYPLIKLSPIIDLTDDTGIIQHAKHSIPDRKTGYTLDDNARALIVATKYYNLTKSKKSLNLINKYLSFIHYVQKENGMFHNLLGYDKKFLDEQGSEDSFGRALWACGYVIASKLNDNIKATAKFVFDNSIRSIHQIRSLRAKAFLIIGLYYYYKQYKSNDLIDKVSILANSVTNYYKKN